MPADTKAIHIPAAFKSLDASGFRRLDDVTIGVFDCPHSTPKLSDHGPLVVRTQDIMTGVLRIEQAARVTEATYRERIDRAEPEFGDLLYSREGTYFGIAAEVPRGTRLCLGQRMVLIRPDRAKVDHRYLKYWLNSPQIADHIHGFRDGSVAERLNLPVIRGLPVFVPELRDQKAIAAVLGSLDDKIEQNRRTGAKLEGLARGVFKAWFVDFEPVKAKAAGATAFPGMPPETFAALPTRFEDSPLGPVPEGWRVKPLAESVRLTMGQSPKSEFYNQEGRGLPFHQGVTDYGFRFPLDRVYCTADGRIAESGDILLSVRAPVGRINVAVRRLILGRGLAGIRHLESQQSFLLYQMFHVFAEEDAIGDGTIYKAVNKDFLIAMPLIVPVKAIRDAFEEVVRPMDESIIAAEKESAKLATLRDYLLPRLLSGRVRVGEASAKTERDA